MDWVRNDLSGSARNDGDSLNNAEGCPLETGCFGYELTQSLDFDTNGDGAMNAEDTYYDYDGDDSNNGWLPIGTYENKFNAVFEGNGHEINNLFINRPESDAETAARKKTRR